MVLNVCLETGCTRWHHFEEGLSMRMRWQKVCHPRHQGAINVRGKPSEERAILWFSTSSVSQNKQKSLLVNSREPCNVFSAVDGLPAGKDLLHVPTAEKQQCDYLSVTVTIATVILHLFPDYGGRITACLAYGSKTTWQDKYVFCVASYPGHPMFFNVLVQCWKTWDGLCVRACVQNSLFFF